MLREKNVLYVLIVGVIIIIAGCQKKEKEGEVKLVTETDTISYLIGVDIGRSLQEVKEEIVLDVVFAGIKDKLAKKEKRFNPEEERIIMEAFGMRMQQKQLAKTEEEAQKNLKEANKFLEENKKNPQVVTTESGLQYIVLKEGKGPTPTDSSRVKVYYECSLLNGKVVDGSSKRGGAPSVFMVSEVIEGWKEVLKLMKVGSKYKVFIPPHLAYGRRGMAHDIGPNMLLVYEIELLDIVK
ncbi:MAG: FKBP-type peptidyl-prolyl cis-trans isomerase [Chitinispirillaceae bacterium]|nr:FKBP-type peptidyl-prolyl cis-trans isomerase [Chitinispirillaceae bacterium]